ncbi:hypothetical protein RQ479_11300 [Mesorhizobium sp. ISC25]|uniref:hypothetical protein n=1 Tax=Mesorhizobium sp. ISC25 TaxID=3077335 RepID=UPI0035E32EB5
MPIFDSDVICDYLDNLESSRRLIPETGRAKWSALRLQALAGGMCDAGISIRWENERRPEHLRYPALSAGMTMKLIESYDFVEREVEFDAPLHVGHIALATCLSWLEVRGLPDYLQGRPRLAPWYRSMLATPTAVTREIDVDRQAFEIQYASVVSQAFSKPKRSLRCSRPGPRLQSARADRGNFGRNDVSDCSRRHRSVVERRGTLRR